MPQATKWKVGLISFAHGKHSKDMIEQKDTIELSAAIYTFLVMSDAVLTVGMFTNRGYWHGHIFGGMGFHTSNNFNISFWSLLDKDKIGPDLPLKLSLFRFFDNSTKGCSAPLLVPVS